MPEAPPPKRLLVCRTDALGDALLALPVCSAVKSAYPGSTTGFLVSAYARDLFTGQPGPDAVLDYDRDGRHRGLGGFRRLVRELQRGAWDTALLVFPDPRVSLAVRLAGIPRRVGSGRRAWSRLYTVRVAHSRARGERHEADYNLDLVRALSVPVELHPPRLCVRPEAAAWAEQALNACGLRAGRRLVVLHPGSRGSAANWPAEAYAGLARALLRRPNLVLLLTGTPAEQPLLERVAGGGARRPRIIPEAYDLPRLAALLARAGVFVSGNTGPMHLAAGLGVPTVAFFPPAGVTGPVRWRPLGNHQILLMPPAQGRIADLGAIPVADALSAVLEALATGGAQGRSGVQKNSPLRPEPVYHGRRRGGP